MSLIILLHLISADDILEYITHTGNIVMNYVNYETVIVLRHKVKLVGWPTGLKFVNPCDLNSIDDVKRLHDALNVGDCKWVALTRQEVLDRTEAYEAAIAEGKTVGKKRKERSDKGGKRGPHKEKETEAGGSKGSKEKGKGKKKDAEALGPPKKKRKAAAKKVAGQLPPAYKSAETIESDTDGESDGE